MSDKVVVAEEEEKPEVITDAPGSTPEGEVPAAEAAGDEPNFLEMSDEDFEKQMGDGGLPAGTPTEPETEVEAEPETEKVEEVKAEEAPETEPKPEEVNDNPAGTTPAKQAVVAEQGGEKPKEKPAETPAESGELTDSEMISAFKEIMAPFKANGKDVQARTPAEAIRLMQMGAGHVKYQQQVRPMLAQAQTLKNNNIDNDTLNFLIEVNNGNVDAIKKLVRDANIDPYEIETTDEAKQADKDYRSKDYSAKPEQVTLQQTLDSVQASTEGAELLAHVRGNDWDDGSRQVLLGDPSILSVLHSQKQSGVYDQITAEIDRQRTLGGLANLSFLDAYHKIGTEMENAGAFKTAGGDTQTETGTKPEVKESKVLATEPATPKPDATNDDAVKAVAAPGTKPVTTPKADKSLLEMSDEDFAKFESQFA